MTQQLTYQYILTHNGAQRIVERTRSSSRLRIAICHECSFDKRGKVCNVVNARVNCEACHMYVSMCNKEQYDPDELCTIVGPIPANKSHV